jgi:hypothetical protein
MSIGGFICVIAPQGHEFMSSKVISAILFLGYS